MMGKSAKKSHRVYVNITEDLHKDYRELANELKFNDYDVFKLALSEWMLNKLKESKER